MNKKNVLVTGGAGFIGSHICKKLLMMGFKVRALDNLLTGRMSNLDEIINHPDFEFINGDIRNLDTCRDACQDIEHVSHQAALGSVPRSFLTPNLTNDINVGGFVNMILAAKDAKVASFVYASSSSVYGDETSLPKVESKIGNQLSPYAVSKYANELYAQVFYKSFGLKAIGLRYFNVFGPYQDPNGPYAAVIPIFIDHLYRGETFNINGDGKQTRDFTYIDNAVQANVNALFCSNEKAFGQVYNIAYGEQNSLLDLVNFLEEITGKKANYQFAPPRVGDIRDSLADISKAKELLGYQPDMDFRTGLMETSKHFYKN